MQQGVDRFAWGLRGAIAIRYLCILNRFCPEYPHAYRAIDHSPYFVGRIVIRSGRLLFSCSANTPGGLGCGTASTIVVRDSHGSMGEDGHRADPTRYVPRNPADDPLLDIRGVAVSAVPQEESSLLAVQ